MERISVLLLLLVASTQAFVSDDIVGAPQPHDGEGLRIAGGSVVVGSGNSFPFELYIRPRRSTITVDRLQPPSCSGVLISDRAGTGARYWALTSARCALAGDRVDIFAGIQSASGVRLDTTRRDSANASDIIVHEDFLRTMQDPDIALIPLNNPDATTRIEADGNGIQAALLPTTSLSERSFLARRVAMAGWGYPNEVYKSNAPTLRQVTSRVVPNLVCTLAHLGLTIRDTHICTNGLINRGPCTGDAGAPLILSNSNNQGTLIGLATHTPQNGCLRSRPGIFTRITSHLTWIVDNTGIDIDLTS